MMAWQKGAIKNIIIKIKDGFFKHAILYSLLILFYSFVYLFVYALGDNLVLFALSLLLPFLAIPTLTIGTLVSKEDAPRVGVGFGLSMLTLLIWYLLDIAIEEGFSVAFGITFSIEKAHILLLYLSSMGILSTWLGSLVGDYLRKLGNKETWRVSTRVAFFLNYLYPIIIVIFYFTWFLGKGYKI
jgi:hypothetical protein